MPERHAAAKRGEWLKDARGSNEIRGKTPGIVGYGKIGTQTGLLAESIGMRVIYHDIEALHAVLAGWRLRGAAIATLR